MKNKIFKLLVFSFLSIFVLNMNWLEKSEKEQIKPVIEKKYMDIVDPPEIDNPGGPIINTIEDQSTNFTDAVIMEIGDSFQEDFQTTTDEDYYVYESTTATCIKFYFTRVATASYDFNVVVYVGTNTSNLTSLFSYQVLNPKTNDIEHTVMTLANKNYYFKVTKISGSNSTNSGDIASPNTTIMPSYYAHLIENSDYTLIKYNVSTNAMSPLNFGANITESTQLKTGSNPNNINMNQINLDEEVTYPNTIIGSDNRSHVARPNEYPYSSICYVDLGRKISFDDNRQANGTGVLVGPNILLTAAHCVLESTRIFNSNISVVPAKDRSSEPYGRVFPVEIYIPKEYYIMANSSLTNQWFDWAIVVLNDNIGYRTGWANIGSNVVPSNMEITIIGYPIDNQYYMVCSPGNFIKIDSEYGKTKIYTSCDTSDGQSGSPITVIINQQMYVIGVYSIGETNRNSGIMLDSLIFNFIESLQS